MGGRDYSLFQYPEISLKEIISGFPRRVADIFALLGLTAVYIGS
jgi:hypothetical protein